MATKVTNGLDLQGTRITNLGDPSANTDATNKAYVDARVAGAVWKESVRAASTVDVVIADLNNGDSVGGVVMATSDRVLLKNQTDPVENGIYIVGATAGTTVRSTDTDSTAEVNQATVFVREGTNADTAWVQTADDPAVGTDPLTWVEFGAGSSYTADGQGIELVGNQFQLELDGGTLQKSASGLRIGSAAAGAGLTEATGVLAVGAGNGIDVAADAISVDAGDGLDASSGTLHIDLATSSGLTLGGGELAIDTSTVVRKFAATVGGTTTINVNHNLGTTDVTVEVFEISSGDTILCDVTRATTNQVQLDFAVAPGASSLRVVVHA